MKFSNYVLEKTGKELSSLNNKEIYVQLLNYVKEEADKKTLNTDKKKVYYISAEFLIGKLLSNNLINLGIYEEIEKELSAANKRLSEVEEEELEPSLGNGGLGRLASCFIDSISSLGINGDGVGLNYHCGLFRQVFVKNEQHAEPNFWIEDSSWLRDTDIKYTVPFKNFNLTSTLKRIDVLGYKKDSSNISNDEVVVIEVKSSASDSSSSKAKNKLQEAINHSDKDFERFSTSIVASYLRLKKSNSDQANVVERFLNITDKPFNVIYGAVAVYSNQSYDIDVIKTVVSKKHRDFQKLRLLVIHSDELMKFIRELYSKASDV